MGAMKCHLALLCFTFGIGAARAQPLLEEHAVQEAQSRLGLSAEVARVVSTSWSASQDQPAYILIQDIHCHGEAQSHIAQLIQNVQRLWGVRDIFIEGAFAKIKTHDLPSYFQDEATWPALTENGQMSGTELALLQSGKEKTGLELIGIDDRRLYRTNLQIYEQLNLAKADFLDDPLYKEHQALLEPLLDLRMTPASFADYQTHKPDLSASAHLSSAVRLAEQFYAVADQRSQAFLDNLAQKEITGPKVMVVGGFHTKALCARLTQEHQSYVVLRPNVTRAGYATIYENRLRESARLLQAPQVVALNN